MDFTQTQLLRSLTYNSDEKKRWVTLPISNAGFGV